MKSPKRLPKKAQSKSHARNRRNSYRGVRTEISLKLVLSWAIALGSIASLFRLLPYHLSQKAKLEELKIQVQETDARVVKLREQLNQNFDPQQTERLMEQYSSLTSTNKSRIYWLPRDKETPTDQSSAE